MLEAAVTPSSKSSSIHFSSGLCAEPWMYEAFLSQIYQGLGKKVNIFASAVVGHKLKTKSEKSFIAEDRDTQINIFHNLVSKLIEDGYGNDVNIQHSAGPWSVYVDNTWDGPNHCKGRVDVGLPKAIVHINPLVPISYSSYEFLKRTAKNNLVQLSGRTSGLDGVLSVFDRANRAGFANYFANRHTNNKIIEGFHGHVVDFYPSNQISSGLLLHASNKKNSDGIFDYGNYHMSQISPRYSKGLKNMRIPIGSHHNEVMIHPTAFAEQVLEFLKE